MTHIECPPYRESASDGPASILTLAARASDAVGVYRRAMDERADFRATVRAAAYLARTTEALTTAIADAVACGENTLT